MAKLHADYEDAVQEKKNLFNHHNNELIILQNTKDCKYVENFNNKNNYIFIALVVIILIQCIKEILQ